METSDEPVTLEFRRDPQLRHRQFFERSGDAFYIADPFGSLLDFNAAFAHLLGYQSVDDLRVHISQIGATMFLDKERFETRLRLLFHGNGLDHFESQIVRSDGTTIWVIETARAAKDEKGRVLWYEGRLTDIHARKVTEDEIRRQHGRYRDIVENAVEGIFQSSLDGKIININPSFARICGYSSVDELLKEITYVGQLYVDTDRRPEFVRRITESGVVSHFESMIRQRDGGVVWVSENARAVLGDDGDVEYFEGTFEDIHQRKQAELTLENFQQRLSLHVQQTPMAVIEWDLDTVIRSWNPSAERIFGYTKEEAIGRKWLDLLLADNELKESESIWELMFSKGNDGRCTIDNVTSHGLIITCEWHSTPLMNDRNEFIGVFSMVLDVTQRVCAEERLAHEATHDSLTGLPNRMLFTDRLGQCLQHLRRRSDHPFAVLFMDVDRFKLVNDSLGHAVGDNLLVAIARRLEECLRGGDTVSRTDETTVARLGGDEFIVLISDLNEPQDAVRVAERVQASLSLPFLLDGHQVVTSVSIGIAIGNSKYQRPEDIIRDADIAMYRAKSSGKARHVIFDEEMHRRAASILMMENDLRRAIDRKEFELYYQPVVSLTTGQIIGFEALIRWHHPVRGQISPLDFVPIAEDSGLIIPIGEWAIAEACAQTRKWNDLHSDGPDLSINVNLSSKQFKQPNLVSRVAEILSDTGLPSKCLRLEITESAAMEDAKSAISLLERLRDLGVSLGIDDFGTGYSSLSYLHRFPVDLLKIDRSFVISMGVDRENFEIVKTIVALAHSLDMRVTAEGVEKPEHSETLKALNCEFAQGYLFSKPLDAAAATALILSKPVW